MKREYMFMLKVPFVDLLAQYETIKIEVIAKISEVINNGDFVLGEELRQFESEFAAYVGVKYGVGVASGTDALYLALLACGVKSDDEVITAANTFIATAIAISQTGAKPVLVDIDSKTYNIDTKKIAKCINKHTKAIIPVHLCGRPASLAEIKEIARKYNLQVIEDAAQAHGTYFSDNKRVGSSGDLACFSFYPAKNLGAYGDGGMVVTNDNNLAEKVRLLRNYGQKTKNQHSIMGFNSRLDNLHAAVLRIKLKYLDKWNNQRRENAKIYKELFGNTPSVVVPNPDRDDHIYHLYAILAEKRDKLAEFLKTRGISTGMHYPIPIHLQECYKSLGHHQGDFPATEHYAAHTLSLPMYPELSRDQIKWVGDSIKEFYQNDR
jgi:dTDP-4-amino-4,6-dideoxygalactose transaminase